MINTTTLVTKVTDYERNCTEKNITPTYNGLGRWLGISGQTIRNVITGYYKGGLEYTTNPSITRCIDNSGFELIRSVFKYRY